MKNKQPKPDPYTELYQAIEEATGIKPQVNFLVYADKARTAKDQIEIDVAFPEQQIALEIQGGSMTNGAHNRGKKYQKDCERMNRCVLMGWKVLWVTAIQAKDRKKGQPYIIGLLNSLLWKD